MGIVGHELLSAQRVDRRFGSTLERDTTIGAAELEDPIQARPARCKTIPFAGDHYRFGLAMSGRNHRSQRVDLRVHVVRPEAVLNVASGEYAPLRREHGCPDRGPAVHVRTIPDRPCCARELCPHLVGEFYGTHASHDVGCHIARMQHRPDGSGVAGCAMRGTPRLLMPLGNASDRSPADAMLELINRGPAMSPQSALLAPAKLPAHSRSVGCL
jgi:hypothetical protein